MTIDQIRREVHRMGKWATSIRAITQHNPVEHKLAVKLYNDIVMLDEAIEKFRRNETTFLAKEAGFDLHRVGLTAAKLTNTPSKEVHLRVERIFMILKRTPKEAIRREEPTLAKAFKSGLADT